MHTSINIAARRLSKVIVFLTLSLIFVGALIKSHEVGLSVPDWPTSYGKQMFSFPFSEMVGGIFYEHGHRLFATIVGFLTLIQFIVLSFTDHPMWVKKTSFIALVLVITQGFLGGMTVIFFLPPQISILHGVLAQIFFISIIFIAYSLSDSRLNKKKESFTLKESFFDNSKEVVFRSFTEIIKFVGKKYYPVRGKKVDNIIQSINTKNSFKVTLGGCLILKVNKTVIVSKE